MRLDIQSLINLHPFFREEQLLDWLKDEGDLFVQSVETGQVGEVMGRIDPHHQPGRPGKAGRCGNTLPAAGSPCGFAATSRAC
jgi:hypothetical protein